MNHKFTQILRHGDIFSLMKDLQVDESSTVRETSLKTKKTGVLKMDNFLEKHISCLKQEYIVHVY